MSDGACEIAGKEELSNKVRHVAVVEGDGAGYDVLSFHPDGRPLYIEVKATRGPITSDFYVTPNELDFSCQHSTSYELRRLYDFDKRNGTCRFYSILGDLGMQLKLTPTEFKVSNLTVAKPDEVSGDE